MRNTSFIAALWLSALAGFLLVLPGLPHPAIAAEFDFTPWAQLTEPETNADEDDGFVRFSTGGYTVTADETVSLRPISRTKVTKIAAGRVTEVDIITTSTGTYSSDVLKSAHIHYPGITVTRDYPVRRGWGIASYWQTGLGWLQVPLGDTGSFALLTATSSGSLLTTDRGSCVLSHNAVYC